MGLQMGIGRLWKRTGKGMGPNMRLMAILAIMTATMTSPSQGGLSGTSLWSLSSVAGSSSSVAGTSSSSGCELAERDADFGQDYYSWTSESSVRECQNKCEEDRTKCLGITYVANIRRNCALYDTFGIEEGVKKRNQDSYLCFPPNASSGGWKPKFLSAGSGISAISNSGGIGASSPLVLGIFARQETDQAIAAFAPLAGVRTVA